MVNFHKQMLNSQALFLVLVSSTCSLARYDVSASSKFSWEVTELFRQTFVDCVVVLEAADHDDALLKSQLLEDYVQLLQALEIETILPASWETTAARWTNLLRSENESIPIGDRLKFLDCRVQVVFMPQILPSENEYRPSSYSPVTNFRAATLRNDPPDFGILVMTHNWGQTERKRAFSYLMYANEYRGTTLEFGFNGSEINLIVPTWFRSGEQRQPLILPLTHFSSQDPHTNRKQLLDLDYKERVLSKLFMNPQVQKRLEFERSTCGNIVLDRHIDFSVMYLTVEECMYLEIARALNVSYSPRQDFSSWLEYIGSLELHILLRKQVVEGDARFFRVLGVNMVPFRFLIVLDRDFIANSNLNSLFVAMDVPSWVLTWLSIVALSITYKLLHSEAKPLYHQLVDTTCLILSLSGTLLGQGFDLTIAQIRFSILFGIWLLGTIIISNGYAGILTALMTTPVIPAVPTSLEELAKSKEFAVFSSTYMPQWSTKNGSTELRIIPSLLSELINLKGCEACDVLANRTLFMPPIGDIPQTSYPFVRAIHNRVAMNMTNGNVLISPNFAFLEDRTKATSSRYMITATLSKQKLLVFDGPANPFMDPSMSITLTDFVYSQVLRPIRAMVESGVYELWMRNKDRVWEIIWSRQSMFQEFIKPDARARSATAVLFDVPPHAEPPKPMGMEILRIPLLVYGVCVGVCCLGFLTELLVLKFVELAFRAGFTAFRE